MKSGSQPKKWEQIAETPFNCNISLQIEEVRSLKCVEMFATWRRLKCGSQSTKWK